ncbi:MAG: CusA/CzcA family heavy metal efflux RND transporter [Methylococcales bacterium]
MASLIQFALTQRTLIILAVLLLIGSGYYSAKELPVDAFPDVSPVQVKIIVKARGMTPEEIESRITTPIELELLGIPQQVMLRSIAKYALTDITLDFAEGTDIYWARQQVTERLTAVWGSLPEGIEGGIAPMTTPLGEMFMFTIDSDNVSLMERRRIMDWVIRPALRTVQGVADVNALGGLVRSYEVIPDNDRMTRRGVTMEQMAEALRTNNRNDGAGRLHEGEETLLVRAEGRIKTLEDVRNIAVKVVDNLPIIVGDIATVRIGALTRFGAVTQDGKGETVEGLVLSLRGANTRQVVNEIREKLAEITPSLPEGVSINIFYDRSNLVNLAIKTVSNSLYQAIFLIVLLLLLFLGNLSAAFTVSLILPLSTLFAVIIMSKLGMTANLMSLGGLAIAIGMLVDSAIVVVDNITMQLANRKKTEHLPRLHIIYRATREVATPITSGTLIVIIVFLPLLTLQGLEGKLFSPMALTIVFALSGALLLALTVIPVFASFFLRTVSDKEPWLSKKLHSIYAPLLAASLIHRKVIYFVTGAFLILTVFGFTQIGKSFLPSMDEGDIVVQTEKLPSITLKQSVEIDSKVQSAILAEIPEVTRIISRVGSDEIGLDPMSLNETDAFFVLKPKDQWQADDKEALTEKIRKVLDTIPGIAYGFTQPIEMRVSEMLTGVRGDVAVKVFGTDLNTLDETAKKIAKVLQTIPGASDIFKSQNEGMQYLQIEIDRFATGRLRIDVNSLEQNLRAQIAGLRLGIVQEGRERTPLIVRGSHSPASFSALQITLRNGHQIPLTSIAKVKRVEGVVAVERERGQRFAVVRSNVRGRDLVGFVNEARQAVKEQVTLPTGYYIEWGGQFENQQRAADRLSLVVPVSLLLIFLLLFSTFQSIREAILILSNIPLALIGGVLGLWISGEYLSVPASVGFIALLGIAVLNGVVMVSYFNSLRSLGMDMRQVVVEGSMRRLRPILMTAASTAFGLFPLLIATGPGSEIQRPLAIVVIGGLVTSTLLTLILLPILYHQFCAPKK